MPRRALMLLFVAAAPVGCGGPEFRFVPVEGVVTQAGRPVPYAVIEFLADGESGTRGPRAWGVTGPDGKYQLRTDAGVDGAVPGRHRVTLRPVPAGALARASGEDKADPAPAKADPPAAKGGAARPPIPREYAEYWKTPLRAEVKDEGGPVNIELPTATAAR